MTCLLILMGFISRKQKDLCCQKIDININYEQGNYFIEREDIIAIMKSAGIEVKEPSLSKINYDHLETLIQSDPIVAKAEVYSTIEGTLKIDVFQRKPVIRIMTNRNIGDFYIDEEGAKMPLSPKFTSRVLIVNGYVKESMLDDLFLLAKYVNKNKFWKAQVQQIYIDLNGVIVLIPRVGNHKIIFGDMTDYEEKFEKLMIFYKKGLNNIGWDRYKLIDLKYKNQVVCTKK